MKPEADSTLTQQPHKLPAEGRRCSCSFDSLHVYVISWSNNHRSPMAEVLKKEASKKFGGWYFDASH